jgi:hypothetical protein
MKPGQKIQAKIKNRWCDVVIKRVNKTTFRVEYIDNTDPFNPTQVTVKPEEVRKKPRKKTTSNTRSKKTTTRNTKTITKSLKTKDKPVTTKSSTPRPGTKKNPWIPLADLRSHNLISNLDYETKVKFESIILSLIKDS